jgi:hypothetical protein
VSTKLLSSSARETINRYKFLKHFVAQGFVPYIPEFDAGVDFMMWREKDNILFKVQLKSRWTVDKKYFGRDIWIAFPGSGEPLKRVWYLVPHDIMVLIGQKDHGNSLSWGAGSYSKRSLSKAEDIMYYPYETSEILKDLDKSKVGWLTERRAIVWETTNAVDRAT